MGRTFYSNRKRIDKLSSEEKYDLMLDLIYAFGVVKNPNDIALFLRDLLTATEVRNLSMRLRIAKLLIAGLTYEEITYRLHVSSVTINKVRIWLEDGGEGFQNVVSKLPVKWEKPKKLPHRALEFHLPEVLSYVVQHQLSQRGMKTVKKFASNIDRKAAIDKSMNEANKYLFMERVGSKKAAKFKSSVTT